MRHAGRALAHQLSGGTQQAVALMGAALTPHGKAALG